MTEDETANRKAWIEEQRRKNEVASERYAAWRRHIGWPLVQKGTGERW